MIVLLALPLIILMNQKALLNRLNFHKKSLLPYNSILPEEKIARMNIQSEAHVLSPQSPKSPKSQ